MLVLILILILDVGWSRGVVQLPRRKNCNMPIAITEVNTPMPNALAMIRPGYSTSTWGIRPVPGVFDQYHLQNTV